MISKSFTSFEKDFIIFFLNIVRMKKSSLQETTKDLHYSIKRNIFGCLSAWS